MNRIILNRSLWGTLLISVVLATSSCKKKDDSVKPEENTPTPTVSEGKFILAVRSNGGESVATDYLVDVEGLMDGEISIVGNGVEQPTYHYYKQTGKYLTTITYTDANIAEVYKLNGNKELESHGKFSIGRLHLLQDINEKEFLAINIPYFTAPNEATVYTVDAEKSDIVSTKKINVFAPTNGAAEQALFSGMCVRGDKLYLPFLPIADNTHNSTKTDTAYVAIYSYPDMVYQGRIVDGRTGPIGCYGGDGHIFKTENNDIYTVSLCSIRNGASQETKQSGILRIKAGENKFDTSYFFNVEAATGFKINASHYLGNGKVLASIYTTTGHTVALHRWKWDGCKLAIIDLNAKTVNYISGVPEHNGGPTITYSNHLEKYNGKVYIKINSSEGIYIYEIDPATNTGKRGAKIVGKEVYGFFYMK